ncbi:MAG TPA: hypothetical protein GYA10_16320 [Alphaproteobacteria bacterium]|nr:hypothetical protein [Alphaproteobacteria bacterium]
MPSRRRILVIAPDPGVRHSTAFALEAEGHVVTSLAVIPGPDAARGFDCVVLDHKAARSAARETVLAFCAKAPPVVLLAGLPQPWLASVVFRVVQTPVVGEALAAAVRDAIAHEHKVA